VAKAGETVGTGCPGKEQFEPLRNEMRKQVTPVFRDRHALSVQNNVPASVEVDIGMRIRGNPHTQFPGIGAHDR
jgi:hypothetical protein